MSLVGSLISCAAGVVIGWLVLDKLPGWLGLAGVARAIVRVIGALIIAGSLLSLFL